MKSILLMLAGAVGVCFIPAGAIAQAGAPATPARAARLFWMSGCWERRSPDRLVEERWTSPRGGILLGTGRTTRGDALVEFEQMHIFARNGKLVFAARPSGQAPSEFTETQLQDSSVVFENPTHDFPQRVSYRRVTADSLFARVEGISKGAARAFSFSYGRVSCD